MYNNAEIKEEEGLDDYDTINVSIDGQGSEEDEDSQDSQDSKKSYPNMAIKIDKDQYSVFEMKRKYDKKKICMDPSFQRNFVWNTKQKSELIESVVMGIPLPLIYLAESQEGNLIVVDGRQRLTTFFDFLNNKFRLNQLKILEELNGKNFKNLENEYSHYASEIEDYQLVVQVIKYPTPDRVRFDIFDRVNRGGTPLNKQEMRNALYQGNSTDLLKKITEDERFLLATGKGISSKHMKDRYIALRAIAFTLLYEKKLIDKDGKIVEYKSDMEDLLGKTMEYLNRLSEQEISSIYNEFGEIMESIYQTLGEDAFRIGTQELRKRPISMTLFEVLYYLFYLLSGKKIMKDRVINVVSDLMNDQTFLRALQQSVDSSYSVQNRFEKIINSCGEIINV